MECSKCCFYEYSSYNMLAVINPLLVMLLCEL